MPSILSRSGLAMALGVLVACASTGAGGPTTAVLNEATWAVELGFPADQRVLVLHADDAGLAWAANEATQNYLSGAAIQSASVMVPVAWAPPMLHWSQMNPNQDVGLHLTLTSEYSAYRWGPVAPWYRVFLLLDWDLVHLRPSVSPLPTRAQVRREIRAQIDRALAEGAAPSHLDSHMGMLFLPDYYGEYLKAAVAYKIPAVIFQDYATTAAWIQDSNLPIGLIAPLLQDEHEPATQDYPYPRLDAYCAVPGGSSFDDVRNKFQLRVDALPPGLHQVFFHPAVETARFKQITNAWQQRVWEGMLFTDPTLGAWLSDPARKFGFTNWKQIMARWACAPEPTDPNPWIPPPRCP